jgi:hypothetical protein
VSCLSDAIQQTQAKLVVVDPIQSFLGADVDAHRANETRPLLDNLARLAKENDCCVLMLRHLSKESRGRSIHRGMGSIDFTGAVRTELFAGCSSKDSSQHAIVHAKSNLGPKGPSLGYSIGPNGFCWTGESQLTAHDLFSPESSGQSGEALAEAKEFLLSALAQGAVAMKKLFAEAEEAGITKSTLKRAKKELKIQSNKVGLNEGWAWSLPKAGS